MIFTETPLKGSYQVDLAPYGDERGWFVRTFCKNEFSEIEHTGEWVQLNHSFTRNAGAIRGLHYQMPPHSEIKLVRCIAGCVYDVIVDLRKNSPTFLQWFSIELSASSRKMIYIPEGFAHGFQTLTDDCELLYHHTAFYTPSVEGGIRHDDPLIKINWPLIVTDISRKDTQYPLMNDDFKGF